MDAGSVHPLTLYTISDSVHSVRFFQTIQFVSWSTLETDSIAIVDLVKQSDFTRLEMHALSRLRKHCMRLVPIHVRSASANVGALPRVHQINRSTHHATA